MGKPVEKTTGPDFPGPVSESFEFSSRSGDPDQVEVDLVAPNGDAKIRALLGHS